MVDGLHAPSPVPPLMQDVALTSQHLLPSDVGLGQWMMFKSDGALILPCRVAGQPGKDHIIILTNIYNNMTDSK